MLIGEMQFDSNVLKRKVSFSFSIPDPSLDGPYPGLLLLHGRGGNHRSWLISTRLAFYLEALSLIAIMPDGGASDWSNSRIPGERYQDFLVEDLIPTCEHAFRLRPGPWVASGWSMGAVGALDLGFRYPDRFLSVAAHCPPVVSSQYLQAQTNLSSETRADADLYAHAEQALRRPMRPVVSVDCGTEDGHLYLVHAFHDHLDGIGYMHEYCEPAGGHNSAYWDGQIQSGLRQHMRTLQKEVG